MTTIRDAYPSLDAARRAAAALRAGSLPPRDIGVLGGSRYRHLRRARTGGYRRAPDRESQNSFAGAGRAAPGARAAGAEVDTAC